MGETIAKRSGVAKLTAAFATVYTVYPAYWGRVSMIHLDNSTGSDVTVRLCLVAPSGTPIEDNAMLWDFTIPANDFIEFGDGYWLPPSSSLQASCSSDGAIKMHWSTEEE
jgi:hypothetical protein